MMDVEPEQPFTWRTTTNDLRNDKKEKEQG